MSDQLETPTECDPLAPDAPISHLLSIAHNPRVKEMSNDQLNEYIKTLRTMATSPQTLTAKIQSESRTRKSKPLTADQIKRKAILDSL